MEEVEAHVELVAYGREGQAGRPARGGLPPQAGIADVAQAQSRYVVHANLLCDEVGARGLAVYIVIAHHVEAHVELEVVDALDVHPALVGEHPACLYRGEEAPAVVAYLDTALGVAAEPGVAVHAQGGIQVVTLAVVVAAAQVVVHVYLLVLRTVGALVRE